MEPFSIIATTLLAKCTLSCITESVFTGWVGNRADDILANKLPDFTKRITNQFKDTEKPINHDLQKAILSSHWLATKVFCEELKKNAPADIFNAILAIASKQIKQINDSKYTPVKISPDMYEADFLILKAKENDGSEILKNKVIDYHLEDLRGLLKEREVSSVSFETLTNAIKNNLENLNWFDLVCAFLNELLKGDNNKAKDAFQNQELAKIGLEVAEIKQVLAGFELNVKGFVNNIGEQRFEEFKALLKEDLAEIKGKIDDILNPQPTLIYDYSHQIQSENKAIFRRRYVPFVGREEEIKQLHTFFESENLLEWQLITSAGGSGKSRLAMEFCYALAEKNKYFQLGFYKVNDKDKIDWHKWQPLNKTLIVIDYVATDYKTILEILSTIYLRENNLKYPVRFLLLEREQSGEWWKKFDEYYKVENYIPKPFADAINLPPLFNHLIEIIAFCLQKANKPLPTTEKEWYEIIESLLKIDTLGRPLFAFYVGLALANGENIRNWKVEDLLENHLKREELHFWDKEKTSADLLEKHKNLVALSTMMGGMNYDVLGTLLEKKYTHLPSVDEFDLAIFDKLSDIREETLRPLEPDILGEYFVHKQLQKDTKNPLKNRNKSTELVGEAWQLAPINMIFFTLRFYQDFLEYNTKENLLVLPPDANEETNYWYCSMFLDLSGILINNGLVNEAEDFWEKIKSFFIETPSNRLLIQKVSVANNLVAHFGGNKLFDKAEIIYGQICEMESENLESEVLNEVLINKVKAAYNLALHFGNNNLLEKAELIYGQICEMESENLESEVLNEVLIYKVKAANNLALHFGNNNLLEKAELIYGQICEMESENLESEVLNEVLIYKVKAANNLALHFGNNNLLEKAELIYGQICEMESENLESEVLNEVLINKVKAANNLALHFGNNNLLEKAELIYGQICEMESENLESEVLNEVLINKVKAANNLALHFGNNNLLEKAELIYGQICEMESENLESEVLNEVLINKVKAANNLALHFGNNNLLEKAELIYGQICEMESESLQSEVLNEVLIYKVKSAYNLYTIKEFQSWHLALQWIAEELLQTHEKHPVAESAIRIVVSLIDFYRKYQTDIPAETSEQMMQALISLVNQYHQDASWQPFISFIIEAFKEFGLLPDAPQE